jgi:DNA-binding ferritin-like protein
VQYHKLFGELYQEISDSVDVFAEEIRALGAYTPGSFSRFTELSQIADETMVADAMTMISRTLQDLNTCKAQLIPLFELSEQSKTYGLSDFIAGRIDALSKHIWMFSATMKR